jgi:hypothetical protein
MSDKFNFITVKFSITKNHYEQSPTTIDNLEEDIYNIYLK